MKKLILLSVLVAVTAVSCKKNPGNPSIIVDVSFPTITPVNTYFSIPVGGALPTGSQIATAYDSVYANKIPGVTYSGVLPIVLSDTNIHTSVSGLYQATAYARSYYGYITTIYYYVAVTSFSGTMPNLAGTYQLAGGTDSEAAVVTPLSASVANGFYEINNINGVNLISSPGADSTAIFAFINDSTIAFAGAGASTYWTTIGAWDATPAAWPGGFYYGDVAATGLGIVGSVTYAPGDTTLNYSGYYSYNNNYYYVSATYSKP